MKKFIINNDESVIVEVDEVKIIDENTIRLIWGIYYKDIQKQEFEKYTEID